MAKETLYQPYEIEFKALEDFPKKLQHNHYFFLVYIASGSGTQMLNAHTFRYRPGNLFLITPQDKYSFDVGEKSQFFILRFHSSYIKDQGEKEWADRMEFILNNASHRPGCILKNKSDKPLMASLVQAVTDELARQQLYHAKVVRQLVNTIILVVARNIALKLPKKLKENTGEAVLDILDYIQRNIFTPQNLKAEKMSRELGISLSYLGRYFKKQTGETLQQYIVHYKLRLVEMRLLHSDMRISEIVYELNFADESHLNRLFKKYKGMGPSAFRKQANAASNIFPK